RRPSRAVQYADIEPELALMIEGANRVYCRHFMDARDVEVYQEKTLGPFYKIALPCGATATGISLMMLGRVLDKEPTSGKNETLRDIVESDLGKISGHRVVILMGPSGSGKTAMVIDLAKTHFVIYCVRCDSRTMSSPNFKDPNFATLAREVEGMCGSLPRPEPGSVNDLMENDSTLKRHAGDRVELEFLARLLFLQLLLNNNRDFEPLQLSVNRLMEEPRELDALQQAACV
ncbi:hypothetical protein BGZ54_002605, partial [Gamsiella multidivaricata]